MGQDKTRQRVWINWLAPKCFLSLSYFGSWSGWNWAIFRYAFIYVVLISSNGYSIEIREVAIRNMMNLVAFQRYTVCQLEWISAQVVFIHGTVDSFIHTLILNNFCLRILERILHARFFFSYNTYIERIWNNKVSKRKLFNFTLT